MESKTYVPVPLKFYPVTASTVSSDSLVRTSLSEHLLMCLPHGSEID